MTQEDGQRYLASIAIRRRLLEAIPTEPAIGFFELREKTRIYGSDLDGGLLELEALGVVKKIQTSGQTVYCKVSTEPEKEWYSVSEAATYLSVSKRTVQQLIRDGEMVADRVGRGGHHRIRRMDLDSPMHRDDPLGLTELNAIDDPVLADLWDNERDAEYDRL